jgi:hypothetical protein
MGRGATLSMVCQFRHDQGGAAAQVTVRVHDEEVLPLDTGPMSSMPSFPDCPCVAEQPPELNSWSHVRLPVSPVELFVSVPKFFTMY